MKVTKIEKKKKKRNLTMIRIIRKHLAKWLMKRMQPIQVPITKETADRWNHLQGVKLTEGNIKINWKIVWQGRKKR